MTEQVTGLNQRQARRVLLLIAGIPVGMMLAATALWWAVQQGYVDILGSVGTANHGELVDPCLLYTSPSPRDKRQSRMPSSA